MKPRNMAGMMENLARSAEQWSYGMTAYEDVNEMSDEEKKEALNALSEMTKNIDAVRTALVKK